MNRQKQYLADNVDAKGNVFPTVGENIRNGVKNIDFNIEGVTNYRLVEITILNDGTVQLSENISYTKSYNENYKIVNLAFSKYYCISSALLIILDTGINKTDSPYTLYILDGNKIGIANCPLNSRAIFIFTDRV